MYKDVLLLGSDLDVSNGDLAVSLSEEQHIEHLLIANAGDYKANPEIGVGIQSYLNASGDSFTLKRDIRVNLKADGFKVKSIEIDGSKFNIDAVMK